MRWRPFVSPRTFLRTRISISVSFVSREINVLETQMSYISGLFLSIFRNKKEDRNKEKATKLLDYLLKATEEEEKRRGRRGRMGGFEGIGEYEKDIEETESEVRERARRVIMDNPFTDNPFLKEGDDGEGEMEERNKGDIENVWKLVSAFSHLHV